MRFQIIALLLALSISTSQAFLGFGIGGFGGLWARRRLWALRRFGYGYGLGYGRFVGGLYGKRSMINETLSSLPVIENPETFCTLNSSALVTSTLKCNGPVYNFECQVERQLNLENVEQELESLRIMPVSFNKNSTVQEHVVLSFNKEDLMFNNFTLNHDDTSFVFSFFYNETFSGEGFRIKDLECWEEFEEMMNHDEQVELKINLIGGAVVRRKRFGGSTLLPVRIPLRGGNTVVHHGGVVVHGHSTTVIHRPPTTVIHRPPTTVIHRPPTTVIHRPPPIVIHRPPPIVVNPGSIIQKFGKRSMANETMMDRSD